MAITVAALVAKLGYDDDEFQKGMSGSESRLSKFGNIAGAAAKAGVAAVAAGIAAVGASVITMEDALTPIMTLTGKNTEQFKGMEKAIKDVMRTSPKSADEIGMSAYTILSAGITDTVKASDTLRASNELALAGLGSLAEATDLVTSAMNSFGFESANTVAQIFFGTINAGKTTTAQLAQGFGQIAPLAASVGVEFGELMAATAALTATGMPASVAYSGLKGALSNILHPSAAATEAAKTLGIDFSIAGVKAQGFTGWLQTLGVKAGGNSQILADLFGSVEGLGAVMALTGPQAQALADNFGILDTKGGDLSARAKEVSETFSNRFKIMKNNVVLWLSEIGEKGLDWLTDKWKVWGPRIHGYVDDFTAGLRGKPDPDGGFFTRLGTLADNARNIVAGIFTTVKSKFDEFIDGWQSPGRGPGPFFADLGGKARDATDMIHNFFNDVGAGFSEFNDVVQGSGGRVKKEGWLGGVDALALFVRDTMPQINKAFDDLLERWKGIKLWVDENWPSIVNVVSTSFDIINGAINFSLFLTQSAIAGMKAAWHIITDEVMPGVRNAFSILSSMVESTSNILGSFTNFVNGPVGGAIDGMRWALETLAGVLDRVGRVTVGAFIVAVGALRTALETAASWLDSLGRTVAGFFTGAYNALANANGAIESFFNGLQGRILGAIGYAGNWLWNTGVNLIQGLIGGINSMATAVGNAAASVVNKAIGAAWNALKPGSPSKVGRAMGQNFGAGIIAGMGDMEYGVALGAKSLGAGMINSTGSLTTNNYGGPGNVTINMPAGSDGNDVVRALRAWQARNGRIPVAVTGRSA
jgi:TP901 family phage tail tape measure protein